MPTLAIHNQRLHYSEHRGDPEGRRCPLVLVHGAGGSFYHWPPALRRLPGHDVYALDLPGHGRSEGPGREHIADYAEVVDAWAAALGLRSFVIAGHSMGGGIALTLALDYNERLAGLALISSAARLRVNPAILSGLQADPAAISSQIVEWVYGPRAAPEQRRQYGRNLLAVDRETLLGDWLACDRFDVRDRLAEVDKPTLILAGTLDVMTPPRAASFLAEHIAGADLTWLEGIGHMAPIEAPALVAAAVSGFLAALASAAPDRSL